MTPDVIVFFIILVIGVGAWASAWGRNGFGWALLAFLISPLISAIILLIAGRKKETA